MTIPQMPPTAEAPTIGCPYCGAPLRPGQDWCLSCGAAVTTQVAGARGWRTPIAIVGVVLALAAAALVFAFLQISDDADRIAAAPATSPTPTPAVPSVVTPVPVVPTPVPGATVTPSPVPPITLTPGASPAPSPATSPTPFPTNRPGSSPTPFPTTPTGGSGTVGTWPRGKTAWTVILLSGKSKSAADKKAKEYAAQGRSVGVLNSSDYSSLRPGYWVVFSGQYDTKQQAVSAAQGLRSTAPQAYARQVKP